MSDYRRQRRLAFICSKELPVHGLGEAATPSLVPWWVRDPGAPAQRAALIARRAQAATLKISSVPVSLWALALPVGSTTCPSTTIGLFQCPGSPGSFAIGRGEDGR